jgi:hypothetical protein
MARLTNRSLAGGALALTAAITMGLGAPGMTAEAGAACTPKNSPGTLTGPYHVRVCGIPDYDQRRVAVTDLGAGRYDFTGLKANGDCHCVPTSFMNVLGYYANKGLAVQPAPFGWETRSLSEQDEPGTNGATTATYDTSRYKPGEATAYEAATLVDKKLGDFGLVKTGSKGCGTSFERVAAGASLLTASLSQGASFSYSFYEADAATPREMAAAMSLGATVLVAYGRYPSSVVSNGLAITGARDGGHAMTVRGVKGGTSSALLSLRDPANDEVAQTGRTDRVRQSPFRTTFGNLKRVNGIFGSNVETLWQLGDVDADGTGRFVDGWMAIWPQIYLFLDRTGFSVSGQLVNFASGGATSRATTSASPAATNRRFDVGAVTDATFVPRTGEVVFALDGSSKVEAVNLATGERRTVGRGPAGIVDLDTDARRGGALVLGARELIRFPLGTGPATRATLPAVFDAVAYDATSDRVAAISLKGAALRLFRGSDLSRPVARGLPNGLTGGAGRLAASFDKAGELLLRREGSTTVRRAAVEGSRVRVRPVISAPKLAGGRGFVATDRGSTLSLVGGKLVETGASGKLVGGSPFAAIRGTGRLASIIRGAADVSPALAPLTVDQRLDSDADFPELATTAPPAGARGLRVLSDDAADAEVDAAP